MHRASSTFTQPSSGTFIDENGEYFHSCEDCEALASFSSPISSDSDKEERNVILSSDIKIHQLLNLAIETGDIVFLKKYIDQQRKVKKYAEVVREALYVSCKYGNLSFVKYLIEELHVNPHILISFLLENGNILKFAAESGNLELVKYLWETHHVDLELRGAHSGAQDTALSRAAEKGHVEIVKYLLKNGANQHANISYRTILSCGIRSANIKVVQTLIDAKANIIDEDLACAGECGNLELVKLLIEYGAEINEDYLNLYKIRSGNIDLLKYLQTELKIPLISGSVLMEDKLKQRMLCEAAESGSVSMMRYLVDEHHFPLAVYVAEENRGELAYKHTAESTILYSALNLRNVPAPLIEYLLFEKKLLPQADALLRLKEALHGASIRTHALLTRFLTSDSNLQTYLLQIWQKGLSSIDLLMLYKLRRETQLDKGYGFFKDTINEYIQSKVGEYGYYVLEELDKRDLINDSNIKLVIKFAFYAKEIYEKFEIIRQRLRHFIQADFDEIISDIEKKNKLSKFEFIKGLHPSNQSMKNEKEPNIVWKFFGTNQHGKPNHALGDRNIIKYKIFQYL